MARRSLDLTTKLWPWIVTTMVVAAILSALHPEHNFKHLDRLKNDGITSDITSGKEIFSSFRCKGLPWFWYEYPDNQPESRYRLPPHCEFRNVCYRSAQRGHVKQDSRLEKKQLKKLTFGPETRYREEADGEWLFYRQPEMSQIPLFLHPSEENRSFHNFPPCFTTTMGGPRRQPHIQNQYCFGPTILHEAIPQLTDRDAVLFAAIEHGQNPGHLLFDSLSPLISLLELFDVDLFTVPNLEILFQPHACQLAKTVFASYFNSSSASIDFVSIFTRLPAKCLQDIIPAAEIEATIPKDEASGASLVCFSATICWRRRAGRIFTRSL